MLPLELHAQDQDVYLDLLYDFCFHGYVPQLSSRHGFKRKKKIFKLKILKMVGAKQIQTSPHP